MPSLHTKLDTMKQRAGRWASSAANMPEISSAGLRLDHFWIVFEMFICHCAAGSLSTLWTRTTVQTSLRFKQFQWRGVSVAANHSCRYISRPYCWMRYFRSRLNVFRKCEWENGLYFCANCALRTWIQLCRVWKVDGYVLYYDPFKDFFCIVLHKCNIFFIAFNQYHI